MRLLPAALILAGGLAAQIPPPPEPPPKDGPKQAVSGRVVDSGAGRPVRGAHIVLRQQQNELASAESDFEGRFSIEEAPVGRWQASAAKPGYASAFGGLTVPAAQPRTGLRIVLDRLAVIAGRVVDDRDRPVAGATVVVFLPQPEGGIDLYYMAAGRNQFNSETDDRGEYRIWNLLAGDYVAAVFPAARAPAGGVLRFRASGGFYPNATTLKEAERISLKWGQVREGVDFRMGPPPDTRVELEAVPPPGQESCQGCSVQIAFDDPEAFLPAGNAPLTGGNYLRIDGLLPSRYTAHLRGFDMARGEPYHGSAAFTASPGRPEAVVLAASGEVPVRGKIVLGVRPDPPAGETAGPWRGGLRAMPPPRILNQGMITRQMFANVEIAGNEAPFELKLLPGDHSFQLMGAGRAYAAAMSLNGKPLEKPELTVPAEGILEGLEVHVRFDHGTLAGPVDTPAADGEGLETQYIVFARPVGPHSGFLRMRSSPILPGGTFRQELAPGAYEVIALEAGLSVRYLANPAHQEILRKYSRRVEIKRGETTQVALTAAPKL
jgi:hypothetical protein